MATVPAWSRWTSQFLLGNGEFPWIPALASKQRGGRSKLVATLANKCQPRLPCEANRTDNQVILALLMGTTCDVLGFLLRSAVITRQIKEKWL